MKMNKLNDTWWFCAGVPLPRPGGGAREHASADKVCGVNPTPPWRQDSYRSGTDARGLEYHQEPTHRGHHPHHGPTHASTGHTGQPPWFIVKLVQINHVQYFLACCLVYSGWQTWYKNLEAAKRTVTSYSVLLLEMKLLPVCIHHLRNQSFFQYRQSSSPYLLFLKEIHFQNMSCCLFYRNIVNKYL